ncbi:sensor domain-containing diguanylate cyclase [Desulfurobacterium sp.]
MNGSNGILVFTNKYSKKEIRELISELDNYDFICGMTTAASIEGGTILNETVKSVFPLKNLEYLLIEENNLSKEHAAETAVKLKSFKPKAIITLVSDLDGNIEEYLNQFGRLYPEAPIVGGVASNPKGFVNTFVFTKKRIISEGIVFLAIKGENIETFRDYAFGWRHLEKKFKITKAFKNRIYEIEDKPVIEFYRHYLGDMFLKNLEAVTLCFPLMVRRKGTLVARACIRINEDESISYTGNFREGEHAYFGVGGERKILLASRNLWWQMTKFSPDKIILFSCLGRKSFLGRKTLIEISPFASIGETTGGFVFGEIFGRKKPILLNHTLTAIGIKYKYEKRKGRNFKKFCPFHQKTESDIQHVIIEMLIHLANTVMKELEKKNREIKKLADTDGLTAIYNRRKILEELEKEIIRTQRYGNPLSVIIFDIDLFKEVNDTYGHLMGDKILREIAQIIKKRIRKPDIFGRYGGEEFLIVLPETDITGGVKFAEKIRKLIENHPFPIDRKITISLGVTEYKYGDTVDTLLARADRALYMAKESGRNKVCKLS